MELICQNRKLLQWAEEEWDKRAHLIDFGKEGAWLDDETYKFLEGIENFNEEQKCAIFSMLGATIVGSEQTDLSSRLGWVIDAIYFAGYVSGQEEFIKENFEGVCWDDVSEEAREEIIKILEKDFARFDDVKRRAGNKTKIKQKKEY